MRFLVSRVNSACLAPALLHPLQEASRGVSHLEPVVVRVDLELVALGEKLLHRVPWIVRIPIGRTTWSVHEHLHHSVENDKVAVLAHYWREELQLLRHVLGGVVG